MVERYKFTVPTFFLITVYLNTERSLDTIKFQSQFLKKGNSLQKYVTMPCETLQQTINNVTTSVSI